jgi:mannose/fructose/N-acetylgalactosamine-specific phosphotransferase system component IIC
MYRIVAFAILLLNTGILTGGVLALVVLGLVAFSYGVRRLDSDITARDALATGFAGRA